MISNELIELVKQDQKRQKERIAKRDAYRAKVDKGTQNEKDPANPY